MELFVCFFSLVRICMNWISYKISIPVPVTKVLLSTLAFSKVCVLIVFESASIDSRPHYRFDASMRKTFEKDRIARCDVS